MIDEDLRVLRDALAAGPTRGPWYDDAAISGDGNVVMSEPAGLRVAHCHNTGNLPNEVNALWIATASPDRIARLLDELERAQRDIDGLLSSVAALDADNERLRTCMVTWADRCDDLADNTDDHTCSHLREIALEMRGQYE